MPFISKTLRYSFYACVHNILKIVTFVNEKMKLASFSYKYITYVKGALGLGGGGKGVV